MSHGRRFRWVEAPPIHLLSAHIGLVGGRVCRCLPQRLILHSLRLPRRDFRRGRTFRRGGLFGQPYIQIDRRSGRVQRR